VNRRLVTPLIVLAGLCTFAVLTHFTVPPRQAASAVGATSISSTTVDPDVVAAVTTIIAPATALGCSETGHSAVVDRFTQRAWLCDNGQIAAQFAMTSAVSQPDPGVFAVYAKDMESSSSIRGRTSTMTHFVAFTYGENRGARIAFHSIPKYSNGSYVQPLESVGTPELFGDSAGCIRLLPDDAVKVWDWLAVGDQVNVIS
jgi:hypothetical protein